MKGRRRARKLQEDVFRTNRIGCGCLLVLFLGLIVTMLIAAFLAVPS